MTALTFSLIVMFAYLIVVGTLLFRYYRPRDDKDAGGDAGGHPSRRSGEPNA